MIDRILKLLGTTRSSAAASQTAPHTTILETADRLIAEGNRAEDAGDIATACERYRRATEVAPMYAKAHLNLGIGLEARGDTEQARRSYETALSIDPADAYANYNLGRQLFSQNSLAQAEPLLRQALRSNPDFPDARVVLSRLLENKGDLDAAATELESALRIRPGYFGALCNYANVLRKLRRPDEAETTLRRAVALEPGNFDANYNLASVLAELGKPVEAQRSFAQALRINPNSLDARASLMNLHLSRGNLEAAAAEAEAALKLRPDWLDLLFDYGLILKRLVRNAQAESAFRRVIELEPTYVRAYQMLGAVLVSQARIPDALRIFAAGREHGIDTFDLESAELLALNSVDEISPDELFARHVDFGRRMEQVYASRFEPFGNAPDPQRRLRVGYVSADFQFHVVPLFLMPVLENRDRSAIEVYCYSTGDTADEFTDRVRARCDVWRDAARKPAGEVAEMIHGDRIDILVDLAGHSGVPNLRVFAQRPAPVQVTWLGYLNTTGLTRIQYRLSDNHSDPPGLTDRHHTEKLLRLPHSQWCYRPFTSVEFDREAPLVKNGHVTFGSFNQTAKISPRVRELWAQILRLVPASRLLVAGVADSRAGEDLYRDLMDRGVDRARIAMAPYVPLKDYYRLFGQVDIALDTTPFSGGTTTCDSLWMGAPVVTAPGVRSWSRSAASVLTTVGLTDWIAESEEDYVRRAVRFALEPSRISELRRSLRSRMLESPLMDERGFARDMEGAYRRMWQSWCSQPGG
jgi:predicted O-linked N-acetylglucosamine transferase (SPINDLY family)